MSFSWALQAPPYKAVLPTDPQTTLQSNSFHIIPSQNLRERLTYPGI